MLGMLVLLGLAAWWEVDRQLEPQRLTATVLSRLGKSLKLDFAFSGTPDYAFRPEPRLRVPDLVVTDPATGKVILRADQLEISLPWATVRGGDPVITRLDLKRPTIDVAGVQRWLAARPKTPFKLPTLDKGMQVTDGTVVGAGWEIRALQLDLPHLATDAPVDLDFSGQLVRAGIDASVQARLHLDHASAASPLKLDATVAVAHAPKPLRGVIALQGRAAFADAGFSLDADLLRIDGEAPLPQLQGHGRVEAASALALDFTGELASWPTEWPALPMPIALAKGPFPFTLAYRGKSDFSDALALGLAMDDARLDANLRVPEMLAWIDAPPASPLPPLTGKLTLPQVDLGGTTLRGVTVEMHDDDAPGATTAEAGTAVHAR